MPQRGSHAARTVAGLRRRLNMTLEEFARAAGVTAVTVARWEKGHACPGAGHWAILRQIAAQAAIDVDCLTEKAPGME